MAKISIGEIFWKVFADTKDIDKALKKTETVIGKLGKAMLAAFTGAALIAGIRKIIGFLGEASEAAAIQESAVVRLNAALETTGQYTNEVSEDIQDFASEMQGLTVVGDETTLGLIQTALNMGLTAEKSKEAAQQAIALSRAYGIDLNTAMIGVVNTQQGQTSSLTRYIPSLKAAADETERLAILNDEAAKAWSIATAEVNSASGAQEQLQNALGDTSELIGQMVNDDLTPFRQKLLEIVTAINDTLTASREFVEAEYAVSDGTATVSQELDVAKARLDSLNESRKRASELGVGNTAVTDRQVAALQREIEELTELERLERNRLARANEVVRLADEAEAQRIADEAARKKAEEDRLARLELERIATEANMELILARYDAEDAAVERLAEKARIQFAFDQAKLDYDEQERIREQERHDEKMANIQAELAQFSSYAANVASIFGNLIQIQMAGDEELSNEKKKNIIALYRIQQAANIAQITVDTASAIMRQYKDLPLWAAIPASILTAGIGVTQIGVVAATPPPVALQDGGIIPASPGGTTAVIGEAGRAEAVIPLDDDGGVLGEMRIITKIGEQVIIDVVQSAIDRRDIIVEAEY